MTGRQPIKKAHEKDVVRQFLGWYNRRQGTNYKVIAEPDPPDAVIRSIRKTRWIEVADVFWTKDYAKDLYSFATPGENHKSVGPGPFVNMDYNFTRQFIKILENKLYKKSYRNIYQLYGPGILVLCMNHPWFDDQTVRMMKETWASIVKKPLVEYFSYIYIFDKWRFQRWPLSI